MAIITIKTCKDYLQITGNSYNTLIEQFIPVAEADYLEIRNVDFDIDSNDDIEYPNDSEFTSALMIAYLIKSTAFTSDMFSDKKSESIGSYSYTKNGKDEIYHGYPRSITDRIRKYTKVK